VREKINRKLKNIDVMKNYNELQLTDFMYLNSVNLDKTLKEHLDESDLGEIVRMRRISKSLILSTSYWFLSKEEVEFRNSNNQIVLERIKIIDDYLIENYSDEVKDFIEYEGEIINKSEILVLVWEDEDCREEGLNYQLDGSDFEGDDFDEIIESIKEFYEDEIERNEGCIEVEVNEKPILHISPDSDNEWVVVK